MDAITMFIILITTTVGFLIGVSVGYFLHKMLHHEEPIGDLRVDESDPEEPPLLFLELENYPNNLKSRKRVTLNVKAENYISQM